MSRNARHDRQTVMQMVDESTALLRRCGAATWLWYFAGTAPFVCMVLHFWNDMTRSGDAEARLPAAALGLAFVYGWMKIAHAIFADRLLQLLRGGSKPAPLPFRGRLRLVSSQLLIHATMPWVLPLALAAMVPFGWAYAFYHSATTLAVSHFRAGGNTRGLLRSALSQAHYLPGPNHALLLVIVVVGMMVWLNFWAGIAICGQLLRAFTGSENVISRNPLFVLDTGYIAATVMLAYLCTGPFVRAAYALRCFHGSSRKNGEDLLAQLRGVVPSLKTAGLALLVAVMLGSGAEAGAQTPPPAPVPATPVNRAQAEELDQRIHDVLQQEMFRWRMPKEEAAESEEGPITSFIKGAMTFIGGVMKDIRDFFRNLWRRLFPENDGVGETSGVATPWADSVEVIVYILVGALLLMLIVVAWRQWRQAGAKPTASAAPPPVDLQNEEIIASQLPENEWLRLAEEKIAAGDLRLALRALFLASLAHLGERRLIAISRAKSNGDYLRELGFRARGRDGLRESFSENVRSFDRAWYGWHEVTREILERFRDNHQRISLDGTPG